MQDRAKTIEKTLKLLRLAEESDNSASNREGERNAARERLGDFCLKYKVQPLEVALERAIEPDKVLSSYKTYGTFFDYIFFLEDFRSYYYLKPVNPYFNSYYTGPYLNFYPVVRPDVKEMIELERDVGALLHKNLSSSEIGDIKNLNLAGRKLRYLNGIENLYHLKFLNLKDNPIKSIRQLEYLEDLEVLNLRDTKISTIKELSNLRNLRVVNLKGTEVEDLKPLNNCPQLEMIITGMKDKNKLIRKGVLVI